MIRSTIFLVATVLLASACGSTKSPVLPPAELVKLEEPVFVTRTWTLQAGDGAGHRWLKLTPAFSEDTGYTVDYAGNLLVFDLKTRDVLWRLELNERVAGGLTLADGRLLLGTSQGAVIALDPANGKELWRATVSSEVLSRPRSARGVVVARTVDGKLYGLDAVSGKRLWIYQRSVPVLTLRGTAAPVIEGDVVISGFDSGNVIALGLTDGTVLWETPIAVARGRTELERIIDIDGEPAVSDGVIYAVTYQGRVAAVQFNTGRILWVRDLSAYSALALDRRNVYVSDAQGQVWAVDRSSGATVWKQDQLARRELTGPALHDKYLVVGDFDGYLHWLDLDDGRLAARSRLNPNDDSDGDDEEDPRDFDEAVFGKARSIIARPFTRGITLFAIDRRGNLSAFILES
ncbi:MAG: outer membrane protein assembly factor BamB [Pseudomonadota bacterium]|nr:MAG: outer membrane protein assembly factor BamB [Pseudomonadota bacterium]